MVNANKFAKVHTKRLNQSENIPKSFRGATFSEAPCMSYIFMPAQPVLHRRHCVFVLSVAASVQLSVRC